MPKLVKKTFFCHFFVFLLPFQFYGFVNDSPKRNNAKDSESEKVEKRFKSSRHNIAASGNRADEVRNKHNNGNRPLRKFHPMFKHFVVHFVGNKGEEEDRNKNRKNPS
jgi:hypothetical protein